MKLKTLLITICCFCVLIGLECGGSAFIVENLIEISVGNECLVVSMNYSHLRLFHNLRGGSFHF